MDVISAYISGTPGGGRFRQQDTAAPATSVVRLIGPGLLVAAAGIGAGDIVSSTMAASAHGLQLLWVVALAAFLKSFLNEGIARWQLATDTHGDRRLVRAPAVVGARVLRVLPRHLDDFGQRGADERVAGSGSRR